jgi:RHS repeat-associated protein
VRHLAEYNASTNATEIANEKFYDAFGNVTSETNSSVDTVFAWTGRFFDDDTGLQLNGLRWYDPGVGRWLSEDPIGFAGGDPNLYRYSGNGPGMFVDPDGQHPLLIAGIVAMGAYFFWPTENAHAPDFSWRGSPEGMAYLDAQVTDEQLVATAATATLPLGGGVWNASGRLVAGQGMKATVGRWGVQSVLAGTAHKFSTDALLTALGPEGTGYGAYVNDPCWTLEDYAGHIAGWGIVGGAAEAAPYAWRGLTRGWKQTNCITGEVTTCSPRANPNDGQEPTAPYIAEPGCMEWEFEVAKPRRADSTWLTGRYSVKKGWAAQRGGYWIAKQNGKDVFPTQHNSGLVGAELKEAQLQFFRNGLAAGKTPGELRGQVAQTGYTRYTTSECDWLAKPWAEDRLQQAIRDTENASSP